MMCFKHKGTDMLYCCQFYKISLCEYFILQYQMKQFNFYKNFGITYYTTCVFKALEYINMARLF